MKFDFKAWFNRVVLGRKPAVVEVQPYVGPDDLADRLVGEANDLFRAVQEKRLEAVRILDNAATLAREEAAQLQKRAEAALKLAADRAEKAAKSHSIAAKLEEFIG